MKTLADALEQYNASLHGEKSAPVVATEEPKKRPFVAPGWYKNLSNDEYHGSLGTSSSQLKTLLKHAPAKLAYNNMNPNESTANMNLGTALHAMLLTPDSFAEEIAIAPAMDLRTKAGRAMRDEFEAEHGGKTVITAAQFEAVQRMHESLKEYIAADPVLECLLADVITESSIYWWYNSKDIEDETPYKELVKVRPDAICKTHSVLIDLKTCADASYTGFRLAIDKYFYHLSAAMYLDGVNQCRPLLDELGNFLYNKFLFLCVENTPPYLAAAYELSPAYYEKGLALYRRAMQSLHRARQNDWPGFPNHIRVIEPAPFDKIHIV